MGDGRQEPEFDSLLQYVLQLKPQTRVDYYDLTQGEKALLRAMCAFSSEGAAVEKSLPELARRASLSVRQVRRLLNGSVRHKGERKAMGLKARGVISELAKANPGWEQAATLRINWFALSLDPEKKNILTRRMQLNLPGLKSPTDTESDTLNVSYQAVQNSVENDLPPGHRVRGAPDTVSAPPGHRVRGPTDTVSGEKHLGFIREKLCLKTGRTVGLQPVSDSLEMLSPWDRLPSWLKSKIGRELEMIREAGVGSRSSVDPEEVRRRVLLACERAHVWPHVADEVAEDLYQQTKRKGH